MSSKQQTKQTIRMVAAAATLFALAIIATWYFTAGNASAADVNPDFDTTTKVAESGGYPTGIAGVVVRRPTAAELTAALGYNPSSSSSGASGSSSASSTVRNLTTQDIPPIHGAVTIDYTTLANEDANSDVRTWQITRKLVATGSSATDVPWRVLADQTATIYTDVDAAPGFTYDYQIIGQTKKGPKKSAKRSISNVLMESTQTAYGFGKNEKEVEIRVYTISNASTIRLTRFETTSPLSSAGTALEPELKENVRGVRVLTDDAATLVAGKVYRYQVEYVKWNTTHERWDTVQRQDDVTVVAGKIADNAAGNVPRRLTSLTGGTGNIRLDWDPPSAPHRSQYALFQVLRKNPKQYGHPYGPVGTAVLTTLTDTKASELDYDHTRYTVEMVDWLGNKYGHSVAVTTPPIPAPECTTASGDTVTVAGMSVSEFARTAPKKVGFAFHALPYGYKDNDPAQNIANLEVCVSFDTSDFYVLRGYLYQHARSADDCPNAETSCTLINRVRVPNDGFTLANGSFDAVVDGQQIKAWYDDTNPEKGLYRYEYRFCAYALLSRGSCTEVITSLWNFEGITEIPF